MFADETISRIARAHGKSSAQVILRWDLQKGVVVIPGSSDPDHIQENISVFDFELTDERWQPSMRLTVTRSMTGINPMYIFLKTKF
ncbi:MAG: aldo/keto reductase [Alistipes indistinctus]